MIWDKEEKRQGISFKPSQIISHCLVGEVNLVDSPCEPFCLKSYSLLNLIIDEKNNPLPSSSKDLEINVTFQKH